MRLSPGTGWVRFLVAVLVAVFSLPAFAVSCTTQSQMNAAQRRQLRQAAFMLAVDAKEGNASAMQSQAIPMLAGHFQGIADSVQNLQPDLSNATLTVDNLYLLDATDLTQPTEADFFCGINNSNLLVTITIPSLPPGSYALAITHATGVKNPQQVSMVLQNMAPKGAASPDWKLAGFFARPMTLAGRDGVWFWKQARAYAKKNDPFTAWFYYETAKYLLVPVNFISSPNLQRLDREAAKVRPANLPGAQPMQLTYNGQTFVITNMYVGHLSGNLDLVVTYQGQAIQDPVLARKQVVTVMRALLATHPGLKTAFHGLWVHVATPGNQNPFALELPIDQIENEGVPSQSAK
jgi:hypothetical protein